MIDLRLGDCREFEDAGLFHALLCDPPYHLASIEKRFGRSNPQSESYQNKTVKVNPLARLAKSGFMGQTWDGGDVAFDPETWAKLAEHLYDGAFGMAFASSRGWHRLACAIEDAWLIIHPTIFGWAYGSGFPKATRIDTAIDKAAGAERAVIGYAISANHRERGDSNLESQKMTKAIGWGEARKGDIITAPATPLAATWAGHRYGLQALKPALEPIIVFQKPYRGKPIECITRTGAGALNIDGARIGIESGDSIYAKNPHTLGTIGENGIYGSGNPTMYEIPQGRWPANFILLDDDAAQALDAQSGVLKNGGQNDTSPDRVGMFGVRKPQVGGTRFAGDSGGASRFFFRVEEQIDDADPVYYTAKASRRERDAGLDGMPLHQVAVSNQQIAQMKRGEPLSSSACVGQGGVIAPVHNPHPTVKPIQLARYLATLLLPPAEYAPRRILIPFAGVGSECIGAYQAGWDEVVGIERGAEYVEIGQARIAHWCGIPIEAQAQLTMVMA